MAKLKTRTDAVPLTLMRAEAIALEYAADRGLVVIEALGLTTSTAAAHQALTALRKAIAAA